MPAQQPTKPLEPELAAQCETWLGLNEVVREADEELCLRLMTHERSRKSRKQFLKRIHSRLNKLRAQRERAAL